MKLGSLIEHEKLSLDMTPLIDIVFLLVLFFAVSTSFISPEHLDELKKSLLSYQQDSDVLQQNNGRLSAQINQLETGLLQQQGTISQLQENLSENMQLIPALNERIIIQAQAEETALIDFQKLLALSASKEETLRDQLAKETERANRLRDVLDAAEKQAKITIAKLDVGLRDLVANDQLGVKQVQNRVIIHLPDNVLFDSGSANIKVQGLAILREVGELLKAKTAGMSIQVGGHTDDVPLGEGNQKIYHDNWGLSSYRAVNVVRFFQQQVGVSSEKLSAVGYGFHRPIAENSTVKGRKLNRRIEIVLLPES